MDAAPTGLVVRRVAGHIGAEVSGVDLATEQTAESVATLRGLLLKHKVLFFRDQEWTHAQHIAFGRQFGPLTGRFRPVADDADEAARYPEIVTISPEVDRARYGIDYEEHYRRRWNSGIAGWHSDMTHAVNPPDGSILYAKIVPPYGGDTQWTNLVAAYEGMPQALRELADGLRAEHTFFAGYDFAEYDETDRKVIDLLNEAPRASVHPVVRVHPETGERALFVSPSRTARIVGFSPADSRHVLDLFFAHITRPEYTCRFRWQPGSVAFWDNRSTAHLAPFDYARSEARRVMYRVTFNGERPVGPDGFVSEALVGDPL